MITLIRRINQEGGKGEEDEDDSTDQSHRSHGNPLRDHSAADDGQSRAEGVAQSSSDHDAGHVLAGGEHDRGDLRPIAPFGEKSQSQRLQENPREEPS